MSVSCECCVLCVVRYMSLQRADPLSRGFLLAVCVRACVCHCVRSGDTITLYTKDRLVEEVTLRKKEDRQSTAT